MGPARRLSRNQSRGLPNQRRLARRTPEQLSRRGELERFVYVCGRRGRGWFERTRAATDPRFSKYVGCLIGWDRNPHPGRGRALMAASRKLREGRLPSAADPAMLERIAQCLPSVIRNDLMDQARQLRLPELERACADGRVTTADALDLTIQLHRAVAFGIPRSAIRRAVERQSVARAPRSGGRRVRRGRSGRPGFRRRRRRSSSSARSGGDPPQSGGDDPPGEPARANDDLTAGFSFAELHARTPGLAGSARLASFYALPQALQDAVWATLRAPLEADREAVIA
jgi:hypothetical protein